MIIIDHAILHILDFRSETIMLSDGELSEERRNSNFILKHLEKSLHRQDAKTGVFYEDSNCQKELKEYIQKEQDFISLSKKLAMLLHNALKCVEEKPVIDLLILDFQLDGIRQIGILECNNQEAYFHNIQQTENGILNEIINDCSVLPSPTQKIEEFAFIDVESMEIRSVAKKYTVDERGLFILQDVLLECTSAPSAREVLRTANKIAEKVAASYGGDEVAAVAAVKGQIADQVQAGILDLKEVGREVFKTHPSMQADYEAAVSEAGLTEPIQMDKEATLKKVCKHKLRTDTGIELTIPTDYFDNTEYVEFNTNEDGTLSITLKHISNIMNRSS